MVKETILFFTLGFATVTFLFLSHSHSLSPRDVFVSVLFVSSGKSILIECPFLFCCF
jgi:hypothetical protein